MNDLIDTDLKYQNSQLIIKPTVACNFNCSFCSAKLLDIPTLYRLFPSLRMHNGEVNHLLH